MELGGKRMTVPPPVVNDPGGQSVRLFEAFFVAAITCRRQVDLGGGRLPAWAARPEHELVQGSHGLPRSPSPSRRTATGQTIDIALPPETSLKSKTFLPSALTSTNVLGFGVVFFGIA